MGRILSNKKQAVTIMKANTKKKGELLGLRLLINLSITTETKNGNVEDNGEEAVESERKPNESNASVDEAATTSTGGGIAGGCAAAADAATVTGNHARHRMTTV